MARDIEITVHDAAWFIGTHISKAPAASIFRVDECGEQLPQSIRVLRFSQRYL
jgi:hypothetical protein